MAEPSRRLRKVSSADYLALASFRHALRHFLHFSESAARDAGLSAQQQQALLAIKALGEKKEVTVGELAGHLILRHHSAVGLVDRLVKKKLLRRIPSKDDRRKVYVQLTVPGEEVIEALSASHRHELRRIGPEIRAWLASLD